jgi:hypothetical protein
MRGGALGKQQRGFNVDHASARIDVEHLIGLIKGPLTAS